VALAGPSRSQLAAVVVVLNEREHPHQQVPLDPLVQVRRLHACGAAQHVDPLFLREGLASLEQALQVHVGHLNRLEVADGEGRALLSLLEVVVHGDDAPDAADQQLLELFDVTRGDFRVLDPEVRQQGLADVPALVEPHRHLVDNFVAAALLDLGLDHLRLVRPHVVLGQNILHRLHAVADDLLVIGGAIHAEQILQHVDRDVRPFLDQLGQVLADDLAPKVAVQQLV